MNLTFRKSLIVFAALMMIQVSCYRDAIDLDLDGIPSQVVIEGIITDQPGSYVVRISKPVDFSRAGELHPVSGAEVMIADDTGNSVILREGNNGYYPTQSIQGFPGRTYSLSVSIEGKKYTATSTMPEAIELDSIRIIPIYGTVNEVICYFTDPAGVENFCRLKAFQNGELMYTYLYHDRYSDGQQIVIDNIEPNFYSGDHVEIQLWTIDEAVFEYFEMISESSQGTNASATLFTLYNPKTNISNNALGYFSAHTFRKYTFVVQ
jgi:hypothetical protein